MKAILVIDVPNDFDLDGAYSNCIVYEGGKHRMWNRIAYVKPMPQISKKRIDDLKKNSWSESEILMYETGFDDCIDEILGAKDE